MKAKRVLVLCSVVSLCASSGLAATVYVSPQGSDANPGTKERPLATLAAARDRVRQFGPGFNCVELADGVYPLTSPLSLDSRDSDVVWRAAHGGKATLSGTVRPTVEGPVTDPEVLALLPETARSHVVFAELPQGVKLPGFSGGGCGTPARLCEIPVSVFQGMTRLEPARWPNDGYARTGAIVGKVEKRHDAAFSRSGIFGFASPRLAAWAKEPDLWAYGLWCYEWADAKAQVRKVDPVAATISVDPAPIGFGIRENAQFYVLNALSELDRPGEWVIDRKRRRVYVWPRQDGGELNFACASGLVSAAGARGITLDGLVFDFSRTDAIVLKDCTNCTVRASTVRRTSSWAVRVRGGSSNRVQGCDLYDLGEGGIELAGGNFESLVPAGHVADNNHIHHYGNIVPNYKPGVQLTGVGNRATHNLIHHSLHQAVAFGGNDHYIGWNVIHDTCTFNDDAGAIYCCQRDWTKRGTVIECNVIHMTGKKPVPTHTEAIYLDDFSSGVVVRGNIINRASMGVYVGGGQDCIVEGNLILNCLRGVAIGSRGTDSFAKNISGLGRKSEMFKRLDSLRSLLEGPLWRSRYPKLLKVYDYEDACFAHNALFNVVTNNVSAGSGANELSNWKNIGPSTIVADNLELPDDPGFVDYPHLNFSLKPGSVAERKLGDLGFDRMGLYDDPSRSSPAVKFAADVTPPPEVRVKRASAVVRLDFDLVGNLPEGVRGMADNLRLCSLPEWGRYKRLVADFGLASRTEWTEYSCSFTPNFDCTVRLVTMGSRGEDTLYDDIRVTGSEIVDGGFETGRGWSLPRANPKDYRAPSCNLEPPYGIVVATQVKCDAAEGNKMACGNDMLNFTTPLKLKKGVRVSITFKARADPRGL